MHKWTDENYEAMVVLPAAYLWLCQLICSETTIPRKRDWAYSVFLISKILLLGLDPNLKVGGGVLKWLTSIRVRVIVSFDKHPVCG